MTRSTISNAASPKVEGPCDVGECESCGETVLVTDPDKTESLDRYGPREGCECGANEFHRVSVDEAMK